MPIVSFSQTIYPKVLNDSLVTITSEQLKQTNLIFLEHNKLKQENCIKDSLITNLETTVEKYKEISNIREDQVSFCTSRILDLQLQNDKYKKKTKTLRNLTIGGFGLSIALIATIFIVQ